MLILLDDFEFMVSGIVLRTVDLKTSFSGDVSFHPFKKIPASEMFPSLQILGIGPALIFVW